MKIAFFLMLHANFPQVRWLINAIYNRDDLFILHIDRKADSKFFESITKYVGDRSNVIYLSPHLVNRFGWSVVETELRAIRTLVSSNDDWKYMVSISGQDYPIKPITTIKAKLSAEWPKNFVDVIPFSKMAEHDPHDPHLARRLSIEIFGRVVTTRIRLPFPKVVDIKYKGSAWFMLTRDFCEWLLSNPITEQIENRVKYTWNPDELFFQAVVMNSPYRNVRAEHYGREIIWPGGTASPKTLCMEDYERLSDSPALFARKFDEAVDRQILIALARDHGYQVPAH